MVHKPKHKVHSFRGQVGSGGQEEINLERQTLSIAYRIVKLELMTPTPGTNDHEEHVVKVYREEQSSVDGTVDFGDPELLAAGYTFNRSDASQSLSSNSVIFDNILFSRNIFVTQVGSIEGYACNYYLELEEVPVGASTLMQLKLGAARRLALRQ